MKFSTFLCLVVVLLINRHLYACDACAGNIGSGMSNWSPMFKSNVIGLRHQFNAFRTSHSASNLNSREYMNLLELSTRISVKNRMFFSAFVPFVSNLKQEVGKPEVHLTGISDIRVQAVGTLWESNIDSLAVGHLIQLGIGLKLPNASYDQVRDFQMVSESMQLGTGAMEYQALALYVLRFRNLKAVLQANYFMPSVNPQQFQFGNRMGVQATFLKEWNLAFVNRLLIGTGFGWESSQKNKRYGYEIEYSGHQIINANIQASLILQRVMLHAQLGRPIIQNINQGATQNTILTNFSLQFFI